MTIITPPPTAPNRADPATFADRADVYVAWWATVAAEINGGALGASFANGTVAEPSVRGNTDTNTGLNFLGSDQLQLVTNGVQRVLLNTTAFNVSLPITGTAVTQSTTDTTAGRLLKVGDFGLGATTMTVVSNLDDFDLKPGWYAATTATTGTLPTHSAGTAASPFGSLLVMRYNATNTVQIYAPVGNGSGGGRIFYRVCHSTGPTWLPWRELFSSLNILGTVSQSGGVPTGAIIEQDSNANGEYTRWADGTQVCANGLTISSGGTITWTFPAAFTGTVRCFGVAQITTDPRVVTVASPSTTAVSLYGWTPAGAAWNGTIRAFAYGRWF